MDYGTRLTEQIAQTGFSKVALSLFYDQYKHNEVYRRYCELTGKTAATVHSIEDIPFLPIEIFKYHRVIREGKKSQLIFESSGTTDQVKSRHYVADPAVYSWSLHNCFRHFFGPPEQYCILALLPTYIERGNSSLVYMVNELMKASQHPMNGFYLHNLPSLVELLQQLKIEGQKTLLFGVSFALLDLAEKYRLDFPDLTIIETGGMKGKRKELTREALHEAISSNISGVRIASEYGMTELLSQAYALQNGRFRCPPWMQVMIREGNDPFNYLPPGKTGGINIIDLANVHSCAFINTSDLGRTWEDGTFEVLGRFDQSDLRGCNLMFEG